MHLNLRLKRKKALVVFTVYLPKNSGLERFNYLALREFYEREVRFFQEPGENISRLVSENGGYGWTGNDLFCEYQLSGRNLARIYRFVPWPETIKPKLCLLGPEEKSIKTVLGDGLRIAAPSKYQNLIREYLQQKNIDLNLTYLDGQVERQIRKKQADLAFDIVYSGKTMREEGLAIYDTIFEDSGLVLLTKD
ncbi:hypothetical protein J4437_03790 [Candidatus Woesearchaeota archaeon]|nr:hypothetical protein [Candidatus Woesearchaeota archaeon]